MSPSKVADCVHNIWENEKLLLCGNLTMMFSGKCTSTSMLKTESELLGWYVIEKSFFSACYTV